MQQVNYDFEYSITDIMDSLEFKEEASFEGMDLTLHLNNMFTLCF